MALENKLGITDQIELSKEEERLSKIGVRNIGRKNYNLIGEGVLKKWQRVLKD